MAVWHLSEAKPGILCESGIPLWNQGPDSSGSSGPGEAVALGIGYLMADDVGTGAAAPNWGITKTALARESDCWRLNCRVDGRLKEVVSNEEW